MSEHRPRLVRIVLDDTLPPGKYRVGGVRVVKPASDEQLGRELRTVQVACASVVDESALRRIVAAAPDLEMA